MNAMRIAFTKAYINKLGKTTKNSGKAIGYALKSIDKRIK